MNKVNLVMIFIIFNVLLLSSEAVGLLEDADKGDVSAIRLRLEDEKEKRLLLTNDVEVLMLKVARLERQLVKSSMHAPSVCTNGGLTEGDRCQCPSNYTSHTPLNLCFRLSKDKQTWDSAKHICESEGGHLAKINSTEILLYIKGQIRNSRYIPTGSFVIIDGNDKEEEGIWRWTDRELIDMKSPVWSPGEPQGGQKENCMYLLPANYLAIDGNCSSMWYYICQIG
ncbi:hypothetical protein CHS0354_004103 [Potamilus streckersoni]|uniref:C-type lectin domain-containing protein n=1 Tax=Potamilus streckersoni TaxID=2493646 RepID=A0AAE0SJ37_9BIVA|nr:hypothetical protein CHS0354_004103 [Potamilus streckersoni]